MLHRQHREAQNGTCGGAHGWRPQGKVVPALKQPKSVYDAHFGEFSPLREPDFRRKVDSA